MKKLVKLLDKNKVKYEKILHRTVYTAYDKAQTLKIPKKIVGKSLVLKVNGKLGIVLIGANKNLDLKKFKNVLKAKKVDFVSEKIIKNRFKGVKVGAIPPFGNLWGLPTFIERALTKEPKIIINGGNYNFSIKIGSVSLKKLIPDLVIGNFSKSR